MFDPTVLLQNKIHFTSLGCARNLVDSEVMIGIALKAGFELCTQITEADFLVINTCGFLGAAREEGIAVLQEIFSQKKTSAKVIVAGCMVQKHKKLLQDTFPAIDFFLGSGEMDNILHALQPDLSPEMHAKKFLEWGEVPRKLSTPKHYAYLKIAEGCRKRCAFCIIPVIKGPLRSKTEEQIVREFKALLAQGVFEVILIAQDLGDFGKDRREKGALAQLLRRLLAVDKNFWLRLLYLYPDEIDDELIAVMKSDPRVCPYLDMPIQHIDDTILQAMRRKTSKEQIIGTIEKLRKEIPQISIRTSLMVGFPQETPEQFASLVNFVQTAALDHVGIFAFSPEEQAFASQMPGQIPEEIKQQRVEELSRAQFKAVRKKNKKMVGKKLHAIVEGFHPDSQMLLRARHQGQCPDIDSQIIINDGRKVHSFGALYEVEITSVADYDLIGRVIKPVNQSVEKTCKLSLV